MATQMTTTTTTTCMMTTTTTKMGMTRTTTTMREAWEIKVDFYYLNLIFKTNTNISFLIFCFQIFMWSAGGCTKTTWEMCGAITTISLSQKFFLTFWVLEDAKMTLRTWNKEQSCSKSSNKQQSPRKIEKCYCN